MARTNLIIKIKLGNCSITWTFILKDIIFVTIRNSWARAGKTTTSSTVHHIKGLVISAVFGAGCDNQIGKSVWDINPITMNECSCSLLALKAVMPHPSICMRGWII